MLGVVRVGLAIAVASLAAGAANAADTVTIGAIYPLTGSDAPLGAAARAAIEVGADIVNTPHKGLDALPLGAGEGLPGLGGAKLAVTFADDLGNPSVATSQVMRLNADHVAALIGAGGAAATLAATTEAERLGIAVLVPDATDPKITARGGKFVFRTTPLGTDFATAYVRLLSAVKAAGTKAENIALVFEKSDRGTASAALLRDAAKAAGFTVVAEIGYASNATDLAPPVTALRDKTPDVAIFISDAADAGLFVKTMKVLDYRPPLLIGDDAGFSDPGFVAANGNLAQGAIDRSVWTIGKEDSPTALVNALYKVKTGRDLDDTGARILQGFLVLADAINRAGATDPAAVQKALQQTDLKPGQLIVGYNGVKFDASGQNTLAATYLIQLQGKKYVSVWPAESAAAKLELPYKAWR
jgi:branched-chain amino acid transport system substrate-binding protein